MENLLNEDRLNVNAEEGQLTKEIEKHTAMLPSDTYLIAAISAMGVSLALKCLGQKHLALFVGQWVSPFLLFGVYNKIVKTHGHDHRDRNPSYDS
ncbi:MAG: hypothetical protein EOO99_02675 [Pedobacter sp.]|nr:MAG: hypothetical protein EOO99_02675 [Pedobacter sp.]